ncbi:methyl-accepting chemotaxis protein [Aminipila luticellarii]|uniref:Methyl-accepting chemotaxis protein n=1 Tax=Aminipila luticellarii TaxID=2507160 RepID=A0A410PW19_9FIRM|nr:methyl-accepting chemotaxis protein [Aminipila luticellarii]QAT43114.1 methyl-accepting chemotaxis protein [Aminipila luticellarii]
MKKWFENINIARKLRTGFLFITFLSIVIGLIGVANIINIGGHQQKTYDQCTLGIKYSANANVYFLKARTAVRDLYMNYGMDNKTYSADVSTQLDTAEENLTLYSKTISSDEDQKAFDQLKTVYAEYTENVNKALEAADSGKTKEELLQIINESKETSQQAEQAFKEIREYNDTLAFNQIKADSRSSKIAIAAMLVSMAIAFILSMLLSGYISKLISQPMQTFADFAGLLAAGDIDAGKVIDEEGKEALGSRKDEVGKLAQAFNEVIASTMEQAQQTKRVSEGDLTVVVPIRSEEDVLGKALSSLVEKFNTLATSIVSSANQVDSGARLVSDSSISLSQGATEQASSVEELTASLEELMARTEENAKTAKDTDNLAKEIKTEAESGNVQMLNMLHAMEEINASSDNIGKIIKVIEDIAFQTNILALNAAVEAARAGQHGRGFAVVADEVRSLAGQSAKAAKETSELIRSSISKVEEGTRTAGETAEELNKIVTGITKVTGLIDNIASASNEQAAAMEQINQGILQISQATQSTAAASEESAAASEELSGQADLLKECVSVFKLKNSGI